MSSTSTCRYCRVRRAAGPGVRPETVPIMSSMGQTLMDSLKWIYVYFFLFLLLLLPPGFNTRNQMSEDFGEAVQLRDEGQLRLKGMNNGEGIVEVWYRTRWGQLCANRWTMTEGDVACRQLGYEGVTRVMRVSPGDENIELQVVLNGTECRGSESMLAECWHSGFGNYTESCQPLELPWVSCIGAESPPIATVGETHTELANDVPAASGRVLDTPTTEPVRALPPVTITDVTSDRVTLSWQDWYDHLLQMSDRTVHRVRIVIKYRRVMDADIQGEESYTVAAETPTYWTHYTITGLQELATYEFVVESVRRDIIMGGEVVEVSSAPVIVHTTCRGPQPVRGLNVVSVVGNATSLHLDWNRPLDGGCPADHYLIEYWQDNVEQCDAAGLDARLVFVNVTSQTRHVINGLRPYSTYTVFVTARNRFGRSAQVNATATTSEAVPLDAPIILRHNYQSQSVLKITWDPPACGRRGGNPRQFEYMLINVNTDVVEHSGITHREFVVLTDVDSLERYKFLVAAITSAGSGPFAVADVPVSPDIPHICGQTLDPVGAGYRRFGPSPRISNGFYSAPGAAPWMAQLWNVRGGTLFCSGSIINEYWILTAAHCVPTPNTMPHDLRIVVGDYDTTMPETHERVYDVAEIINHDDFSTVDNDNDVALIRVSEAIRFSDYIRPICVPTTKLARTMLTTGRYGTVSGWGRDSGPSENRPTRYLKQVFLPVVRRKTCRRATEYGFTSNMFCAGYKAANQGDACAGDSGGPFVVQHTNNRWYVLGIVSWGDGCDLENKYGYYTKLHRYTSWIKSHTRVKVMKHQTE
ncbi:uncharacterized protein [Diadema setosum]|uniref:uncharacterized protein n=1 Tax=Diadema setosum TaxID=31175 RepID=UPI003B3A0305